MVAYPNFDKIFSVVEITSNDGIFITAFLTFFTLLSGGAIGFLISQVWYFFHNSLLKAFFVRDSRDFLQETYHLSNNIRRQLIFLDYVFHSADESSIGYVQRRLDLKHILGSTIFSIIIGVLFGMIFRANIPFNEFNLGIAAESINWASIFLMVAFFIYGTLVVPCFFINSILKMILNLTLYDSLIILIGSIFLVILYMSFRAISNEHSYMVNVVVRKNANSQKLPNWKARSIFTEEYFED